MYESPDPKEHVMKILDVQNSNVALTILCDVGLRELNEEKDRFEPFNAAMRRLQSITRLPALARVLSLLATEGSLPLHCLPRISRYAPITIPSKVCCALTSTIAYTLGSMLTI
jgi:hypothetical protein